MTMDVEIFCITPDGNDPDRTIDFVGGFHNRQNWKMSVPEAIEGILDGRWRFFTNAKGQKAWVHALPKSRPTYLRTDPDTTTQNNLLSLPHCP